MSDTPKQDFYAQSLVEQLSDLVDGIADFNGLPFGEEHEAAPAKASQHSLSDIRAGRVHRNSPRKTCLRKGPFSAGFSRS